MIINRPLLALLSDTQVAELMSRGARLRFSPGQSIHLRGDEDPSLSIILAGRVRFGLYANDGEYIQAGVLGEGHYFGEATLFAQTARPYHADAIDETELLVIKKRALEKALTENPWLVGPLMVTLTTRLYETLEFTDDLRSNSLDVRIAKQLLRLYNTGGFRKNTVQIRQSDLAYGLGQSRVSIGKSLGRLRKLGLIALGYREISIPDLDALRDWTVRNDFAS